MFSKPDRLVVAGITCFWICLHALTGTVTSGYHFQDDHEILRASADLEAHGFATLATRWVAHDLTHRFRPLYYIHRLGEAAVLGDHRSAWAIYTAGLGILSSSLLYLAFTLLRFSTLEALGFAFFSLVGVQGAIWWRLGPNETLGMSLLSPTLFALAWHARTGSRTARALISPLAVLTSLCKESFVLLIPALLFACIWIERKGRTTTWRDAAWRWRAEIAGLSAVVLGELLFIRFVVGTEGIGYAGVEGITGAKVLASGWTITKFARLWVVILALVTLAGLASRSLASLRAMLPAFALGTLIIAPQAILYAKSGVFERYHLPGILGVTFLLSWCLRYWRERRPRARTWAAATAVTVLLLAILGFGQARSMYRWAAAFGAEGRVQQGFVDEVITSCPDGPLMIAGGLRGIEEYFWAIHFYLEHRARQRMDTYYYFLAADRPRGPFLETLVRSHERSSGAYRPFDVTQTPPGFTCIGVLGGDEPRFLTSAASWFKPERYDRRVVRNSGYAVYVRR